MSADALEPLPIPALGLVLLVGVDRELAPLVARTLADPELAPAWAGGEDAAELERRLRARGSGFGQLVLAEAAPGEVRLEAALSAARRARRAVALVLGPRAAARIPAELGQRRTVTLHRPADPARAALRPTPLPWDLRGEAGPWDLIGDVHGCREELEELLERLGHRPGDGSWSHPEGRRLLFLGDLADRGPDSPGVLRLALQLCRGAGARWVLGNHDDKLRRTLEGRRLRVGRGLQRTLDQLEALPPEEGAALRRELLELLPALPDHLVLDGGRLVAAHAGLPAALQGRVGGAVRAHALYGDPTGEHDAAGLPIRRDWAASYDGEAAVVYGHTPAEAPVWRRRTINVDQGCVFGGALTALRWPEQEPVSVPARRAWFPREEGD